jgi:PPOX class probable F420-dependent enzyme
MEIPVALEFARINTKSTLVTIRANTRPQLSNILHHVGDDGVIRVSITADRAKYHNLVRTPWAALHVTQPDFWAYTVIEADAQLSPVAAAPDDATVDELVEYYRDLSGEHEDWASYRASMVENHRVVLRLTPTRAYGMLPGPK